MQYPKMKHNQPCTLKLLRKNEAKWLHPWSIFTIYHTVSCEKEYVDSEQGLFLNSFLGLLDILYLPSMAFSFHRKEMMGWTCAWLIQLFKNDGRFVWPSLSGYAGAGDQMKVRPWLELQKYGEVQGTLASWILWAWEVSYASSRGSLVHQGMVYCWWVLNLTSKHLMAQYIQTLNAKLINKRKKKKWLRILTFIFMMQTFASFKRQYLGRAP